MKKVLIGVWLAAATTMTWASCTSQTYFVGSKVVICNTCCTPYGCNTVCV